MGDGAQQIAPELFSPGHGSLLLPLSGYIFFFQRHGTLGYDCCCKAVFKVAGRCIAHKDSHDTIDSTGALKGQEMVSRRGKHFCGSPCFLSFPEAFPGSSQFLQGIRGRAPPCCGGRVLTEAKRGLKAGTILFKAGNVPFEQLVQLSGGTGKDVRRGSGLLEHLAGVQDDAGAVGVLLGKPCLFFHLNGVGAGEYGCQERNQKGKLGACVLCLQNEHGLCEYVVEQQYAGQGCADAVPAAGRDCRYHQDSQNIYGNDIGLGQANGF